jgi:hypothetical protein
VVIILVVMAIAMGVGELLWGWEGGAEQLLLSTGQSMTLVVIAG